MPLGAGQPVQQSAGVGGRLLSDHEAAGEMTRQALRDHRLGRLVRVRHQIERAGLGAYSGRVELAEARHDFGAGCGAEKEV